MGVQLPIVLHLPYIKKWPVACNTAAIAVDTLARGGPGIAAGMRLEDGKSIHMAKLYRSVSASVVPDGAPDAVIMIPTSRYPQTIENGHPTHFTRFPSAGCAVCALDKLPACACDGDGQQWPLAGGTTGMGVG